MCRRHYLYPFALFFLFLVSCNGARVTSSWKAAGNETATIKKILVLGIFPAKDSMLRTRMEEHLAGDLNAKGYQAATACSIYGPCSFSGMNEMQAIDSLAGKNFDAIMTIVVLDSRTEDYFIPARPPRQGADGIYNHDLGRYYDRLNTSFKPGYLISSTRYRWESNLFIATSKKLLFNIRTSTFASANMGRDAHEYGLAIIKELSRKKML